MKKDQVKLLAALIGLAAAIVIFISTSGPPRGAGAPQDYYLNLNTGELFAQPTMQYPPVEAPGGGMGVRAFVISCGKGCSEREQKIVYVERYTDQAKALAGKEVESYEAQEQNTMMIEQGHMIALPPEAGAEPQWINAAFPAAEPLLNRARTLCDGDYVPCTP